MRITYIQTGGTIDKDYPRGETSHGYEFKITDPAVEDIIPKMNALFDYDIMSVLKKDSLDITDNDREKIYKAVKGVNNDKIIITHGTDTILETAKKLSKLKDKVIILTGAMLPNKFTTSDARFNIGMATAAVQILAPGVYIALYGNVVPWNKFSKIQKQFNEMDKISILPGFGTDKED